MERTVVLKKSELFANLDENELRLVEAITEPREATAGEIICKQGKQEESIYIVEDGAVAIVLEVGPMSYRQVQAACNFESFGWSSLVEPYVCTASVKATEKTSLLSLNGDNLRRLCRENPDIGCKVYHSVAQVVAKRLRQSYVQLLGVTGED